tara:strand:- start:30401 stop:32083 length:1683 start_codon:yes stop_codon:yes gene_type:complete
MTCFKLPITYIKNVHNVNDSIIEDLELSANKENSLYKKIFNPTTKMGENIINLWTKHYTSDVTFLNETQKFIKKNLPEMKKFDEDEIELHDKIQTIKINDVGFHEKYNYIEWKHLQHFNNNAFCMQLLSIYNIMSPVLTLVMPIFFLILPFVILRIQGQNVSISNYISLLKVVFKKHHIGKILTINNVPFEQKLYILLSLFFYVVQIYQNITSCIRFIKNMQSIHKDLFLIKTHINDSIVAMKDIDLQLANLDTYSDFAKDINHQITILERFKKDLDNITPNKLSVNKFKNIGHTMKCYYMLYNNDEYKTSLQYSYDFWGYIDILNGIKKQIGQKYLGKCEYGDRTLFKKAFYPITHQKPVVNNYNIDKHLLITGPNAAGKTTILKTTLFNILLSQQIGYGCFKHATILPYHKLHCYINIPDTSNRDSLFQAEARRCKNILDSIQNDNVRHFCVFDELYSGTNPYEAIGSAVSFINYLSKYKNVSLIITTHYLDICNKLKNNKNIRNCKMKINTSNDGNFIYTYKLETGISNVKGGVKVLKDLKYPEEIIENTNKLISNL